MTARFLSIGECMIELAPKVGQNFGDNSFAMNFAGDTFNTAWYMQQIAGDHIDVAYLTAVGDDQPSQKMTQFMADSGVTPIAQVRAGKSVGLYMVTLTNAERSFSYWRDASAARTLADDLTQLPLKAGDIAYFSGITLAILPDEGRQKLLRVLADAKAKGVWVAFDPNLRPRLWTSTEQMCEWTMTGAACSDICLPSFDDEAAHFGDASLQDTCTRYAQRGVAQVVVKNGPGKICLFDGGEPQFVTPAPADKIVDTTAAGDSFNAQFLASQIQGQTATQAATAACALSRKVIGASGALVA